MTGQPPRICVLNRPPIFNAQRARASVQSGYLEYATNSPARAITPCSRKYSLLAQILPARTNTPCSRNHSLLAQSLPARTNTPCSRKYSLLAQILPARANTPCSHKYSLLAQSLPARTNTPCSHKYSLLAQILSARANTPCSRNHSLLAQILPARANTPCSRKYSLLAQILPARAITPCSHKYSLLAQILPARAITPCSHKYSLLAQSLPARAITMASAFGDRQAFMDFLGPKDTSVTEQTKKNRAQKNLLARIVSLDSRPIRVRDPKRNQNPGDFEITWNDLQETTVKGSFDDWWDHLIKKESLSGVEKDAILLGEAFEDKGLAWRFHRFPKIDGIIKHASNYSVLLRVVIGWDPDTKGRSEQGHAPISRLREDQPAREGPADVCSNPVSNVLGKHTEDGESPAKKRICLRPERPNTTHANEIEIIPTENTPASGPSQKPCMPTSSGQKIDITKVTAPTISSFKFCKLIWNAQTEASSGLSLMFQYCGQSTCGKTGDCVVEYLWSGYSAIDFIKSTKHELEEDEVTWYYKILPDWIDRLPFEDLTDSIKRSKTWEQRQDDKWPGCLNFQLEKSHVYQLSGSSPSPLSARIKCTISSADAPEKRLFPQY
ncbi:hypothetical protein J3E72DRAFT_380016 [Bipolaris maydis]|nr:hypothetical protein J3E72DRAFT_389911 [Bipolaris maydis]KAJ6192233.1 hypothetical protein J3E72DRAFT_380016 [Bipolaris maydis]